MNKMKIFLFVFMALTLQGCAEDHVYLDGEHCNKLIKSWEMCEEQPLLCEVCKKKLKK